MDEDTWGEKCGCCPWSCGWLLTVLGQKWTSWWPVRDCELGPSNHRHLFLRVLEVEAPDPGGGRAGVSGGLSWARRRPPSPASSCSLCAQAALVPLGVQLPLLTRMPGGLD